MHSGVMRKKRKRISLKPAPCLWVLLGANLVLGLCFSKITSVAHARLEGVLPSDKGRIEGILAQIQDVPCLRIDARHIESLVMSNPEVDRAELSRNIFGNALLTVTYRTPTAKLDGNDKILLS